MKNENTKSMKPFLSRDLGGELKALAQTDVRKRDEQDVDDPENSTELLLLLSRFSCVRLWDPRDGSPPGSPVPFPSPH